MRLFEWIGERLDPGPRGGFVVGSFQQELPPPPVVWTCLILSLAATTGFFYLLFAYLVSPTPLNVAITVVATGIYLLLALFVHPYADTSNLGWLGGLVDDPFRWSDDWNRSMIFLKILLMPGRFVGRSFVNTVLTLWTGDHSFERDIE